MRVKSKKKEMNKKQETKNPLKKIKKYERIETKTRKLMKNESRTEKKEGEKE